MRYIFNQLRIFLFCGSPPFTTHRIHKNLMNRFRENAWTERRKEGRMEGQTEGRTDGWTGLILKDPLMARGPKLIIFLKLKYVVSSIWQNYYTNLSKYFLQSISVE